MRSGTNKQRSLPGSERESGFVLGLVLIFFLIFTIIGFAFIGLARHEQLQVRKHYARLRAQYFAEGGLHRALWRLNRLSANQVAFSDDNLTVVFDREANQITATGKFGNARFRIKISVESDHPFRHVLSYQSKLIVDKKAILTYSSGAEPRMYKPLPVPDLDYYKVLADTVVNTKGKGTVKLKNKKFNGIIFVKGKALLEGGNVINGAVVATKKIVLKGSNEIYAIKVGGASFGYPALISGEEIVIHKAHKGQPQRVAGVIYATKKVELEGGMYSGPIMSDRVKLMKHATVSDSESKTYYVQPPGFVYPVKKTGTWRIKPGSWQRIW